MGRVVLDTGVLVACARGRMSFSAVAGEGDVAIPAIAVAEYLTGVELTADEERRSAQRGVLAAALAVAPVIDYTMEVAEHHAVLLAHVRRAGAPRGRHDLIIAACARATGRTILTGDTRARFAELPGVEARVVVMS